jgi:hypothetical protein
MSSTAMNYGELHSYLTSLGYRQHMGSWDFRIVFDFLAVGLDFRPPAIEERLVSIDARARMRPKLRVGDSDGGELRAGSDSRIDQGAEIA